MTKSSSKSNFSKSNSKRYSKSKVSKSLLVKALKNGRGVYANEFVRFLALNIISHNTTIEIALTALLPKEIADIMIMILRSWSDFKVYSERVLLDKVILPSTNQLKNIVFSLSKIKFSYIESCIILVGKLLIVIAILKHQPKNYIVKLRKDLSI
jgi:hypothetical protein